MKVEKIPGVFPAIEIERDDDGWAKKIVVKGIYDELVVEATGANDPSPWLNIQFNGEDLSVG